jgi:ABC-type transport system involved in cytochrome c biogenesis permease subunit
MNKLFNKSYLSIISAWLFLTVFVDFVIVPKAFGQLGDIFIASEFSHRIFSSLNLLEVVFGILLFLYSFILLKNKPNKKTFLKIFINVLLISISALYYFFLTDKIAELTEMWKTSIVLTENALITVKEEHSFYQNFYSNIDFFKISILAFGLILVMSDKGEVRT